MPAIAAEEAHRIDIKYMTTKGSQPPTLHRGPASSTAINITSPANKKRVAAEERSADIEAAFLLCPMTFTIIPKMKRSKHAKGRKKPIAA